MFRPYIQNFNTVIGVKKRIETDINGAKKPDYIDSDIPIDFCEWKGKGGTESTKAGVLTYSDTAEITMWYRPDIKKRDQILLNNNPDLKYGIISAPENIENRNQFLKFKVQRTGGG